MGFTPLSRGNKASCTISGLCKASHSVWHILSISISISFSVSHIYCLGSASIPAIVDILYSSIVCFSLCSYCTPTLRSKVWHLDIWQRATLGGDRFDALPSNHKGNGTVVAYVCRRSEVRYTEIGMGGIIYTYSIVEHGHSTPVRGAGPSTS